MTPCQVCGILVEIPAELPAEFVVAARCTRHAWTPQSQVFVDRSLSALESLREAAEFRASQVPTSTPNAPQTGAQSH